MQINFTQEEANALIQLIDMAVKTGGLNVAQAGSILAAKIEEAFKNENVEKNISE